MFKPSVQTICGCVALLLALLAALSSAQEFEGIDAEDAAIDSMVSTLAAATVPLPPEVFAVQACLPYNLLITPNLSNATNGANSTESGGRFELEAPAEVLSATQVQVIDGLLALSVNRSFEANSTIKATLFPANATALSVVQNFGPGKIVARNLSSEEFSTSASSLGGVYMYNLNASSVRVISAGTTTVLLNGTIGDADVQTSGTARASLLGVSGTVDVELEGISSAYIEGSPGTKVQGTAGSLSRLLYTEGDCGIRPSLPLASRTGLFGRNFFGNRCRKVEPLDLSFQHTFSCGLISTGTSNCSGPRQGANVMDIPLNVTQSPPAPDSAMPGADAAAQADPPTTTPVIIRFPGGQVTTGIYTSGPRASVQVGRSSVPGTDETRGSSLTVADVECDDSPVPMLEEGQDDGVLQ